MGEWISVDKKIPSEDESVLVFQYGNDVCDYLITQATLFEGSWYPDYKNGLIDYSDKIHVTHWQPLPEPPTEL